jgi:hypothetical protein
MTPEESKLVRQLRQSHPETLARDVSARGFEKQNRLLANFIERKSAELDAAGAIKMPSDAAEMLTETDNEVGGIWWSKSARRAWATEESCSARRGERVIVRALTATETDRLNQELTAEGEEVIG